VKRLAVVVLLFVLAGLAAGAIWTLLQPDRYRADARVLVRPTSARIVPAVEALAESSLVKANVTQTLRLSSSPEITAKRGDAGVLTVSAKAGSRDRARQIDAEAVVILTQKVAQRFRAAGVSATVLDPAHVAEQTSPTPGRDLLITGLAGLVVGIAVALGVSSTRPAEPSPAAADPRVEQRLNARIEQVTQRERALARRAGQLAAREQDLARREEDVERRAAEPEAAAAAELRPAPEPAPEPEPEPQPEPEPVPQPTRPAGRWTLQALEALTRERSAARTSSEQQDEWSTYLFFLREHADADGALPPAFDQLVNDVFGPLPRDD
jgi:capsular polysaccharide biosynthesis protein